MIIAIVALIILGVSTWLVLRRDHRLHLYLVSRGGEVVYRGNDLNAAKEAYKIPVSRGVSVHLYAHGKIRGRRTE